MIITFCGHSQFIRTAEYEQKILAFLEEKVGDNPADFYLGGYGSFDSFARECCRKYQTEHPHAKLVLITPYMTIEHQKNHLAYEKDYYDAIVYPELEDKPLKFAISYRNKWMVENSWGASSGYQGNLIMTDEWFNEYMFRLVVDKKYVPENVLKVLNEKPTMLPAWDPMFMPEE